MIAKLHYFAVLICLLGITTFQAHATNYSLNLNGSSAYAGFNSNYPSPSNDMTIEAWIKPSSIPGGDCEIVSWGNSSGATRAVEFRMSGGKIEFGINDASWDSRKTTNTQFTANNWTHCDVVKSVSSNYIKFYVNGSLVESFSNIYKNYDVNRFEIGALLLFSNQTNFFPGNIDDVRIWNVAKSDSEINSNFNSELTGSESNLVTYYNMNQGTGVVTLSKSVAHRQWNMVVLWCDGCCGHFEPSPIAC
jgi:hypothetical protein